MSFELKLPKQEILSRLIERQLGTLASSDEQAPPLELGGDEMVLGRHSFRSLGLLEVLTLADAAELLRVEEDVVRKLAEDDQLPGRLVGDEWRFARQALLDWLSQPAPKARASSRKPRRRS